MKFHIKQTTKRGKVKFVLTINHPRTLQTTRRRERRFFNTRDEAEAARDGLEEQINSCGVIFSSLKPYEQADMMTVAAEAKDLGTTLRGLLDFYKRNNALGTKRRTITLSEMVAIVVSTKTTGRRRQRYVSNLKYILERFARGRESLPLSQVTPWMVNDFLASQKGRNGPTAGSTVVGILTKLRTLFSVATKNDTYLDATANPMRAVERPYVDSITPVIFSAEDAAKLLWVCRVTDRKFLPMLVLGLFGGIRPEELEKLRWRDIHMEEGQIVIEEGVSKTRARRVFDIEPILRQWLLECPKPDGAEYIFETETAGDRLGRSPEVEKRLKGVRQTIKRHREKLCERSGVKWHQDILRKTAASWLMWKYENETKVAGILGNSPKILHDHYRGLLRRAEGEKFEALTPDKVCNDPIELPKGGQGKKAGVLIKEKTP